MEALTVVRKIGEVEIHFWRDAQGEYWVPGEEIGRLLGYSQPRKSIEILFHRNQDLLGKPDYSAVLKLGGEDPSGIRAMPLGEDREARVYSEEGVYLLLMTSRQPKAREFQILVARLLKQLRRADLVGLEEQLAETRMALTPGQRQMIEEYREQRHQLWKAKDESEHLKKEAHALWNASQGCGEEWYVWAHIHQIAREGVLRIKSVWWTPGRKVLKVSFET